MTSPGEPQVLRPFHRSEALTIADAALKAASCPSPLSRAFWLRGASRRFHHLTRPVASSLPGGLEHGVFNQFLHAYELATRPTACAAPQRSAPCPQRSWGRRLKARGHEARQDQAAPKIPALIELGKAISEKLGSDRRTC